MDAVEAALAAYPWGIYLCLLVAPFIQEDAAVIGAASASTIGMGDPLLLFIAIIVGLSASDLWKYWAGRAARTYHWAEKFAQKEGVLAAKEKVLKRLGHTLMAVRFIPGTRIPTYVASGFFKAPFGSFALWVVLSGIVYIGLTFGLFHALGEVGGAKVKAIVPLIAISLVVLVLAGQFILKKIRKKPVSV
jgi:membrane protein DedA with SNARE-associated domain